MITSCRGGFFNDFPRYNGKKFIKKCVPSDETT